MWKCDPENILNYSCVAMVIKIIGPHGDKEALLSELITHEGMVSQMCLIVSFINEYILYVPNLQECAQNDEKH